MRRISVLHLSIFTLLMLAACLGAQKPAPVTMYGTSKGPGSAGVHSVLPGDTLYSISQRYNIPMRDIALVNKVSAPFTLEIGQRLKLPPPREYTVRKGDTLYTVSRIFGVNTSEVASLNNLQAPYAIKAGETLRLPFLTRKSEPATSVISGDTFAAGKSTVMPVDRAALPEPVTREEAEKQVELASAVRGKITAETPQRSSSKFLRPVKGPILSRYGSKADGLHNDGINIKAEKGDPVEAAENGVVVYAGNELKGSGNLILVRHADRWMTAYAHLNKILVRRGDTVSRGQTIATVGSTGSVDTPQLHFEVRRGTEALNPEIYIDG